MFQDDHGQLPVGHVTGYLMWDGTNYLLYAQMLRQRDDDLARAFFCPSSRLFAAGDSETGLRNLGVPGKRTASSYFARGTDQGAPTLLDGRRKALLADLYYSTIPGRNHATGINVLYSDGAVWFQPLPATWDLTSSNAWSQLDGPMITAMP